jgi:hypothetical protein
MIVYDPDHLMSQKASFFRIKIINFRCLYKNVLNSKLCYVNKWKVLCFSDMSPFPLILLIMKML